MDERDTVSARRPNAMSHALSSMFGEGTTVTGSQGISVTINLNISDVQQLLALKTLLSSSSILPTNSLPVLAPSEAQQDILVKGEAGPSGTQGYKRITHGTAAGTTNKSFSHAHYVESNDSDDVYGDIGKTGGDAITEDRPSASNQLSVCAADFAKIDTSDSSEVSEDDDIRCNICCANLPEGAPKCNHVFCEPCLFKFKALKKPCPSCKVPFKQWKPVYF